MRTTGGNNHRWTSLDLRLLRTHGHLGAAEAARLIGCSVRAAQGAAHRYRISLRRRGSRRGTVLGQPRGVSLARDLREDLISGRVDPELVARRMRIDACAELCPACAQRPIRVRVSGLCTICHTRLLTEKHREVVAEQAERRAYNAAKQAARRSRDGSCLEGVSLA